MGPSERIGQEILKATFDKVSNLGGGLLRKTVDRLENEEGTPLLPLILIAFAVVGQATRAELLIDGLDFTFLCNATPAPPEAVLALGRASIPANTDPSLPYLARAMAQASQGDLGAVRIETWDGARGMSMTLNPKGNSQQRIDRYPFDKEGWTWRFSRSERSRMRSLGRFVGNLGGLETSAEASVVRERALYCGLQLTLNRVRVNKAVNVGPCLIWCSMAPLHAVPALELTVERPHGARLAQQTAPAATYAVLGLGSRNPPWHGLRLVIGGALYEVEEDLGFRDACVLGSSAELEANLEENFVVPNQAYRDLLALLQAQLLQMAISLLDQVEGLGHDEVIPACQVLEDLATRLSHRQRNTDSDLSVAIERAARACLELRGRFQEAGHVDRLPALEQLALALQKQGRAPELHEAQLERVAILRALANQHKSRRRPHDAVEALQTAIAIEESLDPRPAALVEDYRNAAVLMKENRIPNSEAYLERALALTNEAASDVVDPAQVENLYALAEQYRSQRNYVQAEKGARQALGLAERLHGDSAALVPFLQLLADILKGSDRYAEGTDFERRAVRLRFLKR